MIEKRIYPVHEQNMPEFNIEYSGHVLLDESWHWENECNPFSRLYYVKSGSGFLQQGDTRIELSGGKVYLIPAECVFSYGCTELEKIYFHISVTTTEKYELLSKLKKIYSMPFPESDFNELLNCYYSDSYMALLKLKTILFKTLTELDRLYDFPKDAIKQYSDIVEKTMQYIQENARINLDVKTISKQLFISESKLRKAFKEETGTTVGKYIDELVFLQAKKLLVKKQLSIKEISRSLGFCDQFYFSRCFKTRYAKTPSEYRKDLGI